MRGSKISTVLFVILLGKLIKLLSLIIDGSLFIPTFIGLPAVITLSAPTNDVLVDGVNVVAACRQLEEMGAAVVGLNCGRGPSTMLPLLKEIVKVCKVFQIKNLISILFY